MLPIRHFTSSESRLEDRATGAAFLWNELESIDVPVSWRLSVFGPRPVCTVVFGFGRGRRCQITPARSHWTGRMALAPLENVLRQAIAAASPATAIAPRALLMSEQAGAEAPPLLAPSLVETEITAAEAAFARFRYRLAARRIATAQRLEPRNARLLRLDAYLGIEREDPAWNLDERLAAWQRQAPADPEARFLAALLHLVNDWPLSAAQLERIQPLVLDRPVLGLALAGYWRRKGRDDTAAQVLQSMAQAAHSTVQDAAMAELTRTERAGRAATPVSRAIRSQRLGKITGGIVVGLGWALLLTAVSFNGREQKRRHDEAFSKGVSSILTAAQLDPNPLNGNSNIFATTNRTVSSASPALNLQGLPALPAGISEAEIQVSEAKRILAGAKSDSDLHRARDLLERAAAAHQREAMVRYAVMCEEGLGGPVDKAAAERCLREGADHSNGEAMFFLAAFLTKERSSRAIPDSEGEIQNWLRISAQLKFEPAIKYFHPSAPLPAPPSPRPDPEAKDHAPIPYYRINPVYPIGMRYLAVEGTVTVDFHVDPEGNVQRAHAVSSDFKPLEPAAVEAVRHWRFLPAVKAGKAVDTHMKVPIVFSMNQPG